MSCYFMVDVYIDENKGRGAYSDYIEKVKPIVESFGGDYLVRSETVTSFSPQRKPDRVIVIRFPSREQGDRDPLSVKGKAGRLFCIGRVSADHA